MLVLYWLLSLMVVLVSSCDTTVPELRGLCICPGDQAGAVALRIAVNDKIGIEPVEAS